jgi:uncharacterized protein YqkB
MWSEKTRQGVVGRYTFYDDNLIDVEFLPVFIKDYGQPYFLDPVLTQFSFLYHHEVLAS